MIVIDTETRGLNPRTEGPTHIGFYDGKEFQKTSSNFMPLHMGENYIAHNAKFDMLMLHYNKHFRPRIKYDTVLLSQLYDSRQKHSLDNLGQLYLGEGKWGDKKILAAIKNGEFWKLSEEDQYNYLRRDCEVTWKLFHFFKEKLNPKLWELYESFDSKLLLALTQIETTGFTIDTDLLTKYKQQLELKSLTLLEQLFDKFGAVNFESPKQIKDLLEDKLGTKLKTVDDGALDKWSKYIPELSLIRDYRETNKYLRTYIENIEKYIYEGKVYPQFHLAGDYHTSTGRGTQTGRTSSSNPNLQNQPRTNSGPVNIRALFRASEGTTLLAIDYSQLELKVASFLSGEENLLNGDIHQQGADVLRVERQAGKTCNFAMLYGAGRNKLYISSNGSKHVDQYIEWFNKSFPKAVKWIDEARRRVEENGRVETYLGRVRYMEDANAGPNTIIQGSGGDIGKEALLRVQESGYNVLGIIHDELLAEVNNDNLDTAVIEIPKIMTSGLKLHAEMHEKVQLNCSVKVGTNWGSLKEVASV